MDRIVVYTAAFGAFEPREQEQTKGARFVCFTDRARESDTWEFLPLPETGDPYWAMKQLKILSHQAFPEAEATVWIDCDCALRRDPVYLADKLPRADLALFAHWKRRCAYEEIMENIGWGHNKSTGVKQLKSYLRAGLPPDVGLYWSGFIVRRHTDELGAFSEAWWGQVQEFGPRDQAALTFTLDRMRYRFHNLGMPNPAIVHSDKYSK